MKIHLTSSAFQEGGMIPPKYTCDGDDVSPPLSWKPVPPNVKSLALIADDPDAPNGTWVHWVMYDIPPEELELSEGIPGIPTIASGGKHGINDFKRHGYGGPCPPSGTHRYYFKLYALDCEIDLPPGITKDRLEKAMEGHIVGEGKLMGRYHR